MGKHRHSKDKLFITYNELREQQRNPRSDLQRPQSTPFYCCNLTFTPFINPYATKDGCIFDLVNIVQHIKRFKCHPFSSSPLQIQDLIKLNFHKNQRGQFIDPITLKALNQNSTIAAIRGTGNVYNYLTLYELNIKPKIYQDLITSQPFSEQDIIILHKPGFQSNRTRIIHAKEEQQPAIRSTQSSDKILSLKRDRYQRGQSFVPQLPKKKKIKKQQIQSVQDYINWALQNKIFSHERLTSVQASASLTCTGFSLPTPQEKTRTLNKQEIKQKLYEEIRRKKNRSTLQIQLSVGTLSCLLFDDLIPWACHYFVQQAEKQLFNNFKLTPQVDKYLQSKKQVSQTRVLKGQSIVGHSKLGLLIGEMLTRKITLGCCKQLDQRSYVFGQVIEGQQFLIAINNGLKNNQRPKIWIKEVRVLDNGIRKTIRQQIHPQQGRNQKKEMLKAFFL